VEYFLLKSKATLEIAHRTMWFSHRNDSAVKIALLFRKKVN
jgi:hypothetical protein